jgi:hypothetical protein
MMPEGTIAPIDLSGFFLYHDSALIRHGIFLLGPLDLTILSNARKQLGPYDICLAIRFLTHGFKKFG